MDIDKIIYFLKDIEKRVSGDSAEAIDRAVEIVEKKETKKSVDIYCSGVL